MSDGSPTRRKMPRDPAVVARDERVAEMLRSGASYDEIQAATGINRTRISVIASREGLLQRRKDRVCSVDKCGEKYYAKNYCRLHYGRWTRAGSVDDPVYMTPEECRESRRRRAAENQDKLRECTRQWRAKNPEKRRAHRRVEIAVKFGRLTRKPCEVCGDDKSQAHHDNYSRPLDVIWLCALHHKRRHVYLRRLQKDPDAA